MVLAGAAAEPAATAAKPWSLTYAQDLALAPDGAVRLNEYYVSQYLDHTDSVTPTSRIRDCFASEPCRRTAANLGA